MKGVVKWFNKAKGYGFIIPEDGKAEVFVHMDDVPGGILDAGDPVSFNYTNNDQGRRATKVYFDATGQPTADQVGGS